MNTSGTRLGTCDGCDREWPVSLLHFSRFERNGIGDASMCPVCLMEVRECEYVFDTEDICDLPESDPIHSSLVWTRGSHEYKKGASA